MLGNQSFYLLLVAIVLCYSIISTDGSVFRKEAFRDAKRQNNIPMHQQPIRTTMIPDRGSHPGKLLRQYDFKNNKGEMISIRKDLPQKYNGPNGAGDQGHHYNAGPSGGKLKQHFNFDKSNSKKQG